MLLFETKKIEHHKESNLTFNELNKDCRNSLVEFYACNSERECEGILKNRLFTFELVPVDDAKKRCMELSDDLWGCDSFSDYHELYIQGGDIPNHGSSKWACIAPGDGEWLDDGWHRFHSYVAAGDSHVPLLTFQNPSI